MSKHKTINLSDDLYEYLLQHSVRESQLLQKLRDETAQLPLAAMQISPDQGQLLSLLVRLCGAQRAIEIGIFTGYSSICIAQALPEDGHLLACDVSEEWTRIAMTYWQRAGLEKKIDLQLAPALETLKQRLNLGEAGSYDFAFIDADKENYLAYYEACLQLVRSGGLICIDNVLWGGSVLKTETDSDETRAIQALNEHVYTDERVEVVMLSIADGLSLARKN